MKGDVPKSNGAAQSWNGTGVAGRKGKTTLYLKHYAEEESRQNWIKDFHETIPEHVDPPYDRDRFLPGH